MLKLGIYKHYKGNEYKVVAVAKNSETTEDLVVYRDIEDKNKIWARPLKMFLENVEVEGKIIPRFKFISGKQFLNKKRSVLAKDGSNEKLAF